MDAPQRRSASLQERLRALHPERDGAARALFAAAVMRTHPAIFSRIGARRSQAMVTLQGGQIQCARYAIIVHKIADLCGELSCWNWITSISRC
jgi:hypothetical protein